MNSAARSPTIPEFKSLFKQAMDLKNEERVGEAVQILGRLVEMNPSSASVHALLGDALWDLGRLAEAIASFQRAVELAPESEMASLGLFHTLLESGDQQRAVVEMNRFLSVSDSEEYQALALSMGHKPLG